MDHSHRLAGVIGALLVLPARPLISQTCAGSPSFSETRFRAAASFASYAYATALGASFSTGGKLYATFSGGTSYDREQDARTYDLSLTGGADITDNSARIYFCPLALLSISLGPYDYLLSQTDYRYIDVAVGVGVAVPIRSSRFSMIPGMGGRVARIRVSRIPSEAERQQGVPQWTQSDTYWHFSAGLGFVFKQTLTIKPEFTLVTGLVPPGEPNTFAAPFGRDENDLSVGVTVAFNFGRRSR